MVRTASAHALYRKFEDSILAKRSSAWVMGIFEGSPSGSAYSWCSDCVAARGDLRAFLGRYRGDVRVVQFKVGSQLEWEGPKGGHNPFKSKFPHLTDLPTAILFRGNIDAARIIQPKQEDLDYMVRRVPIFDSQIRDGSWRPPKRSWGGPS